MTNTSPYFITSNIFRQKSFGTLHPLSGERVSNVVDLCCSMGWLKKNEIKESKAASVEMLSRYHDIDYIEAVIESDKMGKVEANIREKYSFGTMENPLFKGLFKRAATTVGGSILAAELVENGGVAFHPSGGTHHGWPNKARGFCYFNDPVFAIINLLDQGLSKVVYVDLDAHHGDGVEHAFVDEPRVWTFSIHEENRWPYTGLIDDTGGGQSINIPVPQQFSDEELEYLMQEVVIPKIEIVKAEAVIVTMGADGHQGDPLSKMALSNHGLWRAVEQLISLSPRSIILGGGGYNPWTTSRLWSGIWGRFAGFDVSSKLSEEATEILQSYECDLIDEDEVEKQWLTGFDDPPCQSKIREEIKQLAQKLRSSH